MSDARIDTVIDENSSPVSERLTYTFSELFKKCAGLEPSLSNEVSAEAISELDASLRHAEQISRQPGDEKDIERLALWLSRAILPNESLVSKDYDSVKLRPDHRAACSSGIQAIKALLEIFPQTSLVPQDVLLTLITFSYPNEPWSTSSSTTIATSLLDRHKAQVLSDDFIFCYLLQQFIRPLFTQKQRAITAAGRKAMPSSLPLPKISVMLEEKYEQPWRYRYPYTITVLGWIVENIPETTLQRNYPLVLPPLLTLLDTSTHSIRLKALALLPPFFSKLGPKLLTSTGLGDVFSDVLSPLLLSFPSLTPLEESVEILPPVYEAFFALVDSEWEVTPQVFGTKNGQENQRGKEEGNRAKMLEMVLRKGILIGWNHCAEKPEVVEVLVRALDGLVGRLGAWAIRSLKDIIPMLTNILLDPFLPSIRPSILLATLRTLQTTILNAWPRIGEPIYRRTIMKALALCWIETIEEKKASGTSKPAMIQVVEKLKLAGELFVRALRARYDWESVVRAEVQALLRANGELEDMFNVGVKHENADM